MKKICFVVSNPFFANSFITEPIAKLSSRHKIYLICNTESDEKINVKLENIANVIPVSIRRNISILHDLKILFVLIKLFSKEKFDVVHTLTPKAGLIGMLAAYFTRTKNRVHTFTGQVWDTKKGLTRIFLIFLDHFVVFLATKILVDGLSQKEYLIQKRIITSKNAVVLNNVSTNGIDIKRFKPDPITRKKIRDELNISNDSHVFMYLGRIHPEKGIEELINSFLILADEIPDCYLYLVGPNEMGENEDLINISKRSEIYFFPYTEKPENILQICDVFCFPSHREGFGYSVIQASACKKPVICSDIYGLKYTCIDQITGLKFRVKSTLELKTKMKYLVSNPLESKKMGEKGRKYVEKNFLQKDVICKWLNFYESLLES